MDHRDMSVRYQLELRDKEMWKQRAEQAEADAEMWRGLCHARAAQLNEAYNIVAVLRTEKRDLEEKAAGLQDCLDDLWADMQVTRRK